MKNRQGQSSILTLNRVKTLPGVPAGFYNCTIEHCEECHEEVYISEKARDTREAMQKHKKIVIALCMQCADKHITSTNSESLQ